MQERKLKSIEKSVKQIHNPNIILPIVSDSEENYQSQDSDLENEQLEEDLDLVEIDEIIHPATNQDAK
ncbi:9078_t:CDS:2 [Scutellospora calospora]|uniref:9078_t:CDS:1 n=1 Tax=Scutellospora calospora TaxID=85575 RepID=A0ACA9LNW1_9GLOM|nr:9078_t:CDS:2 [Scutellospora calospora]